MIQSFVLASQSIRTQIEANCLEKPMLFKAEEIVYGANIIRLGTQQTAQKSIYNVQTNTKMKVAERIPQYGAKIIKKNV